MYGRIFTYINEWWKHANMLVKYQKTSTHSPENERLEPENHPFEKESHLLQIFI